jgi:hypothetical protein
LISFGEYGWVDVVRSQDQAGNVVIGGIMEHIEQAGITPVTLLVLYIPCPCGFR